MYRIYPNNNTILYLMYFNISNSVILPYPLSRSFFHSPSAILEYYFNYLIWILCSSIAKHPDSNTFCFISSIFKLSNVNEFVSTIAISVNVFFDIFRFFSCVVKLSKFVVDLWCYRESITIYQQINRLSIGLVRIRFNRTILDAHRLKATARSWVTIVNS